MLEKIENLKIESSVHKISRRHITMSKRRFDSFIIRASGTMEYSFGDATLTVNAGEAIFIPRGSTYTCRVISEGDSIATVINLSGDFFGAKPSVYPLSELYCAEYITYHFSDLWNFGSSAERCKCYSYAYDLLSYVFNCDSTLYPDKRKFDIIEPAVVYLREHIYDTSLKIDSLHKLCGISHTYFRKIFITRFGISPKSFVTEKRISRAKAIIDSGEFEDVKSLSQSVGYPDAMYFGKVFKKHYGYPPSIYGMR